MKPFVERNGAKLDMAIFVTLVSVFYPKIQSLLLPNQPKAMQVWIKKMFLVAILVRKFISGVKKVIK